MIKIFLKTIEYFFPLIHGYPNPIVSDPYHQIIRSGFHLHTDLSSWWGELDGVAQQVVDQLTQRLGVAVNYYRAVGNLRLDDDLRRFGVDAGIDAEHEHAVADADAQCAAGAGTLRPRSGPQHRRHA